MNLAKQTMQVAALVNGTVIDHIPCDKMAEVISLLHLQEIPSAVTYGQNLESKKMGKKGLIKISDRFLTGEEVDQLSVIAPNITLSIIKDYEVVEKREVSLPTMLKGIVKCNNPKCITNNEPMQTVFYLVHGERPKLRCHYCEKEQSLKDIKLI